jgi:outer membrane protein OmpA-like peptidoglycan-associated protein
VQHNQKFFASFFKKEVLLLISLYFAALPIAGPGCYIQVETSLEDCAMRSINILLIGALLIAGPASAWADPTPSADDIVNSLAKTDSTRPCEPSCRGIHAIAPAGGGGSTAPEAAAPTGSPGSGTLDLSVQFATGSAVLTPSAEHVLSRLGQALRSAKLAADRFRIEGHTDTVGDAAQNQALSEARAASVAAFLEKNFGVDTARLETVGLGEKDLAVQTPDNTPEPRNRRVHIVNLGA